MNDERQRPLSDDEVNLRNYLNIVLRRKKTLILTLMAVFVGVALYTFTMKPVYEASATLHVQDQKGQNRLLQELTLSMPTPADAELEIIRSRTNAENVVRRLRLNWLVEEKSKDLDFKIHEFTAAAPPQETKRFAFNPFSSRPFFKITLIAADTFMVEDHQGKVLGRGQSNIQIQTGGITLNLEIIKGKPGDSFRLQHLPFNATAGSLRGALAAREVKRNTNIIQVTYSDTDPVRARDVVNSLVQVYLDRTVSSRTEEASRAVEFVEEQLKVLRGELVQSERNLQAYKSSSGVIKLDSEAQELIKLLSEAEKTKAEVMLEKKQLEFAMAALQEARKRGTTYSPAILRSDPLVGGMAARLSDLEVQLRALLSEYTEAYPAVKSLRVQIDEVEKRIQAAYETTMSNILKRENDIVQQLATHEARLRHLPEAERELAQLMRVTQVNAEIYTFLLQKNEEARIAKASTISNVSIVDPAITPERPIKPRKSLNLLLGLVVGLMGGLFLAFFHDYLDDTIKDTEEAKRLMGLPLLAVIPFVPTRADNGDRNGKYDRITVFTQREPKSHVAEVFRSLRTNLHFSAINRNKKVILITSSFPGEGKSTISANLANTFSQTGAKVLIVDCDLRRSSLHVKLGCNKTPGLTELLVGDKPFAEVIQDTGIPGIDLLSSGTTPPNPAELLGSIAMRHLLSQIREKYDHILIDAPPVLAVTDAPVLTTLADIVLIVMESGRVPVKAAENMREVLANVQAPTAGLIINDRSKKGETYGYYGGGYYRYQKGYGYGYYSDDAQPAPKKETWWKRILARGKRG